jgi:HD-GYP domain-containing protein (c-di-GMP phosphodiesterase class II)
LNIPQQYAEASLCHHERFDGRGYPIGLAGMEIPIEARIISVADAYDAMVSKRWLTDHKKTSEEALRELKRNKGTQFDSYIVDVFVRMMQHDDVMK